VVQALEAIQRQTQHAGWAATLGDVRRRVEEGASLSEAMEAHPAAFDAVCRSLVAAGESSGKLDELLERLATLVRQQQQIRTAVAGALVYPVLLISIAGGVLGVMVAFVIPRFEGLFEALGAPLPPTTKAMIGFSHAARDWWWAALPAIVGLGFAARAWVRSTPGRSAVESLILSLPSIGPVARSFATARLVRMLGVLMAGKVPLIEALRLTGQSMTSARYRGLLDEAEKYVTRGESVSDAFRRSTLVAPGVVEALRNGERTGQVSAVLLGMAEYMDEDNSVIVKSLTQIIEPVLLILLGLTVGAVALSLFMPLFDLTAAGGGGGESS
jgi:type II secretory pathway component PulF